ncbi:MAG TPA: TlpA disulfide reductase family protein [Pyrinomonadaceae bacterium]|nr:TlpA disulfide reductase family protein [Pyrinomonadaceae bacterium]
MFRLRSIAWWVLVTVVLATATVCFGQARSDSPALPVSASTTPSKPKKTIFRDSDGNLISNNEFVDIRMANPSYKDATLVNTLDDGTIEFKLQKVPQEGEMSRPFSLRALNGQEFDTDKLKGKVVVLNFWFIGCPPCMAEIPRLNELKEKFETNADVIFVALTADDDHAVKRFLSQQKFDYDMIADAKSTLDSFRFRGYPKNIVIGKDGKIVYWRSTVYAWEKFESVIKTELEK